MCSTVAGMGGDAVSGEVIVLYQDAFQHLDKTNCGMLPTKLLGPLLRFVGENPSDAEVQVRCNYGEQQHLCFLI